MSLMQSAPLCEVRGVESSARGCGGGRKGKSQCVWLLSPPPPPFSASLFVLLENSGDRGSTLKDGVAAGVGVGHISGTTCRSCRLQRSGRRGAGDLD